MARVVEDGGATTNVLKPLKLPVYEPGRLPDPVTCAGALIMINSRTDGNPRPALAISNGASWDIYARVDQVQQTTQIVQSPTTVEVTPLIQQAVRDMLPALVPRPQPQALPAPMPIDSEDPNLKLLAAGILEMEERLKALVAVVEDHSRVIDHALIPVPAGAAA